MALLPGLTLVGIIAVLATVMSHVVPLVGAPVFAIVGGVLATFLRPPSAVTRPGVNFASKTMLQVAIVTLGAILSFHQVLVTGASSIPVMLPTLTVALLGAFVVGRALKINTDLRTLIGVGTSICGASAIAATDSVIAAPEADVSYAIATIFLFNVAAVLTFPWLGHVVHASPHGFGLWAGTAVNDVSSVAATAAIFGHGATSTAIITKLTRTLMIIPITLFLAFWRDRRNTVLGEDRRKPALLVHLRRTFPKFIIWFLVAVALDTFGVLPSSWHTQVSELSQFLITAALAGVGLSTKARDIRKAGVRPMVLGATLWILVSVTSLFLLVVTGGLHSA